MQNFCELVHCKTKEDTGEATAEVDTTHIGIVQRRVAGLKQQSLDWVHRCCLGHCDGKRSVISKLGVMHEATVPNAARNIRGQTPSGVDLPTRRGHHLDSIAAACHHASQRLDGRNTRWHECVQANYSHAPFNGGSGARAWCVVGALRLRLLRLEGCR